MLDFGQSNRPDAKGFPAFGHVGKGMEVVNAIADGELSGKTHIDILREQILTEPVEIVRAYRVEKTVQ